jgi:hypothetical protein
MISETYFASKYTSFWNDLLPGKNKYIRFVVNNNTETLEPPLESTDVPSSRGFINYIAFRLSIKCLTKQIGYHSLDSLEPNSNLFQSVFDEAKLFIENFEETQHLTYDLHQKEVILIKEISKRIYRKYLAKIESGCKFFPEPSFQGCGIINSANGDIIIDNTLVEIKAGKRNFTINDIKQILVYATLNSLSNAYEMLTNFELYNPREGIIFHDSFENLCNELACASPYEIYSEIKRYIIDTMNSI